MSLKKVLFAVLALLFTLAPATAESRNIYVGDIVTLTIDTTLSAEDLQKKFEGFEILSLDGAPGRYTLSVRTFEPGEHTVIIGDKELLLSASSTLDDIEREDIFEADEIIIEPGFSLHRQSLLYAAAGVFALSAALILVISLRKRSAAPEKPYLQFVRRSGGLSVEDFNYFVDLTLFFKEYIEAMCKCRIAGKTTGEISEALGEVVSIQDFLPDIRKWLTACDVYKFSGVLVSNDEKRHHREQLLSLVQALDGKLADANEGSA